MASSLRHVATEPNDLNKTIMCTPALEESLNELTKKSTSRTSDSELSVGTNSLSHSSHPSETASETKPPSPPHLEACSDHNSEVTVFEEKSEEKRTAYRPKSHRESAWEILEGLRDGQKCERKPEKMEGYLMKKRKWPLKGWHKRFFVLDKGILVYAKSPNEMVRGKIHGSVDVGLSVISTKSQRRRIDIDAEEQIYHLKVKTQSHYQEWVSQLRHHRLYRQHEISYGSRESPKIISNMEEMPVEVPFPASYTASIRDAASRRNSRQSLARSSISKQSKVAAWIIDSSAIDHGNKDLSSLQDKLYQLDSALQQLKLNTDFCPNKNELTVIYPPVMKKGRKRFHLKRRKKYPSSVDEKQDLPTKGNKYDKQNASLVEITKKRRRKRIEKEMKVEEIAVLHISENVQNVSEKNDSDRNKAEESFAQPNSEILQLNSSQSFMPNTDKFHSTSTQDSAALTCSSSDSRDASPNKFHEEFVSLAKEVHNGLKNVNRSLQTERERLKQVLEAERVPGSSDNISIIQNLRNLLNQTLQQNKDLRAKLQEIYNISSVSCVSPTPGSILDDNEDLTPSLSNESVSALSVSEFFDAAEKLSKCSTSSEGSLSEEGGSVLSEVSDEETEETEHEPIPTVLEVPPTPVSSTGRRTKLPVPKPDAGNFSLRSLLFKNIGKDLSKISMPVTLNEPLCVLQRLCEELEYSELLDKAAETDDKFERMVYIAAFAVSAYNSSYYRAGHKPFNPVLGETYECIREDKGFQFLAEQVSHHPPISVCHAESKNFVFYQDMRVKTKFWGKSMEILPLGTVHVYLPKTNEHYQWNKVTSCIHNLFGGGQTWVDQYGEMFITEEKSDVFCKLSFVKASYWSNKRQEIFGTVTSRDGKVVHNLFGKWTEALYCGVAPSVKCIWRPGTMPEDYELYYGFTQFAIELNELDPELEKLLPPTDTRFRPDQRHLEEGNIEQADICKQQIEESQRERRRRREELDIEYKPLWFKKEIIGDDKEQWVFTKQYWETRQNPGFRNITFPEKLW